MPPRLVGKTRSSSPWRASQFLFPQSVDDHRAERNRALAGFGFRGPIAL